MEKRFRSSRATPVFSKLEDIKRHFARTYRKQRLSLSLSLSSFPLFSLPPPSLSFFLSPALRLVADTIFTVEYLIPAIGFRWSCKNLRRIVRVTASNLSQPAHSPPAHPIVGSFLFSQARLPTTDPGASSRIHGPNAYVTNGRRAFIITRPRKFGKFVSPRPSRVL